MEVWVWGVQLLKIGHCLPSGPGDGEDEPFCWRNIVSKFGENGGRWGPKKSP